MRPRHITQSIRLMNPNIHLIPHNEIHQLLRIPLKLPPRHQKIEQRRPHQPHILRAQPRNRKRRHSARRIPERDERALARHAVEREIESRLPDAVKDGHDAFPARQLIDALLDVLVRVVDHMRSTRPARQLDLLSRASRPDHIRPDGFQQLAQPQSRAARGGVDKDPVVFLDVVGFADQSQSREALQQGSGGDFGREVRRDFGRFGGGRSGIFCVSCFGEADDAVAGLERVDFAGAGGDDCAFGFAAEHVGPVGGWVEAGAEVAVLQEE